MSVSAIPSASPSEWEPPPGLEVERIMLVLKKQQEVANAQGQGLVRLIEQAGKTETGTATDSPVGGRFNAYA